MPLFGSTGMSVVSPRRPASIVGHDIRPHAWHLLCGFPAPPEAIEDLVGVVIVRHHNRVLLGSQTTTRELLKRRGRARTCAGADDAVLARRESDLAVIDEAAQALDPACWIPILKSHRVVLAGDHRQLPPTIISREAERGSPGVTLFDRLMARAGPALSRLLTTQYRMHRAIMEYPSRMLYEGRLEADAAVAAHLLCDLPGIARIELAETPLRFIHTRMVGKPSRCITNRLHCSCALHRHPDLGRLTQNPPRAP